MSCRTEAKKAVDGGYEISLGNTGGLGNDERLKAESRKDMATFCRQRIASARRCDGGARSFF